MVRFHQNIRYQNTIKVVWPDQKSSLKFQLTWVQQQSVPLPPLRTWGLVKCAPIGLHRPAGSYHIATTAMPTNFGTSVSRNVPSSCFCSIPTSMLINVDQCWSMLINVDHLFSMFQIKIATSCRSISLSSLPKSPGFFPGLWLLGRRLSWVLHGELRLGLPRSTIAISEYPCSIWIPATSKIWRFPKNGTSPEINDL